jgi:uncharacterized protein (TIGR03435 family)
MFRQMTDDLALVREYARNRSETAFAALVSRHLNLVYSIALREVRDPHLAEEVTQAAFIILARKAGALGPKTILSGWLCRTARYVSAEMLRSQRRRQKREQEAYMQSLLNEPAAEAWMQIAPLLETAMAQLGEQEHNAIVLRFYEGKALKQVGAALGTGEDAARMRINRALEKLRKFFAGRGLTLSAAVIAAAVSTSAVQAAPAGLAATVTTAAVQGTAVTTSTLTLIKGALKIMAWTKAKTAIVSGVVVLLAAGTTTITVKEIQAHRTYSSYPWQGKEGVIMDEQVNQPSQVRILPSKFHTPDWAILHGKLIGTGVSAQNVVASAYGYITATRVVFSASLPTNRYDYIACLPYGPGANEKALQAEVKRVFGVVGKIETRAMDVWLLKVKYPNAPGLKRNNKDHGNGLFTKPYGFHGWHEAMYHLAYSLEDKAGVPVFDQTRLTDFFGFDLRFDFDLNCTESDLKNHDWDAVNQALGKLGLELVPTNMPIKMLVVENVK